MAVFCKPFTTAVIRYFDRSDARLADEWIRVELPVAMQPASASTSK
jgi:hypothetical protein